MLLAEVIDSAYEAGRAAWPAVALSRARFGELVAETGVQEERLSTWPSDFFLACAAGELERAAVEAVDREHVTPLASRIRRLGARPADVPDILQSVRERLFLPPRPRIRAYDAAGPLKLWIKVVAVRLAIDLHRARGGAPAANASVSELAEAPSRDVETALTRARFKTEFQAALEEQLKALPERDRTILRLHLVQGVSLEQIAASYGVHRVTATRWVWNAAENMLDGMREYFARRHGFVPAECDSLARIIQSAVSFDLGRLLDP